MKKYLCAWIILMALNPIKVGGQELALERIASGLSLPVSITNAGDGSNRLFVTLKQGKIVIFNGTRLLATPFLDISGQVSSGSEQGLLSVAFHPQYQQNGFFYINYTDTNGDTIIKRFSVSNNPDTADLASGVDVLKITQPFSNHNGGQMQFGPDGYLYIGTGDGGSGGDPRNRAQNLRTLLGKMLRIDVDAASPYGIPNSNPFVANQAALNEIWALGLRNPWRFSFDRLTGDLFIADVGQNAWEEINYQVANSTGGENYGWRLMEGNNCFDPSTGCNDGSLQTPIIEYPHSQGCSVTGGYTYRGLANPLLMGVYIFGDFCSGTIFGAVRTANGNWRSNPLLETNFLISTFGEDEQGEIYFAHYSSPNGEIYRIKQNNKRAIPAILSPILSE